MSFRISWILNHVNLLNIPSKLKKNYLCSLPHCPGWILRPCSFVSRPFFPWTPPSAGALCSLTAKPCWGKRPDRFAVPYHRSKYLPPTPVGGFHTLPPHCYQAWPWNLPCPKKHEQKSHFQSQVLKLEPSPNPAIHPKPHIRAGPHSRSQWRGGAILGHQPKKTT